MGEKKRLAICCGVSAPTSNLFIALSMEKTRSWFQLYIYICIYLHVFMFHLFLDMIKIDEHVKHMFQFC